MTSTARALMDQFAERTGIESTAPQQRYLWTDAFAVCNFLELHASGIDPRGRDKALVLIDAVHRTLGRHRDDDARSGWISGLPDHQARQRPTAGGLRIGKPLPERILDEPANARREWDQDGQYFHYLTRWMHALDQAAWHTGDATYRTWASELAAVAFGAFSYLPRPGAPRRMYWKMSIDLSRPLVPAMGLHDPLDGYVTCLQLASSAGTSRTAAGTPVAPSPGKAPAILEHEVRELTTLVSGGEWATDDPLGLGGLMTDAYRLLQIEQRGTPVPAALLPSLLADIGLGLNHLAEQNPWRQPAERRLAFRELGLAIGLRGLESLRDRLPAKDPRGLRLLLDPLVDQRALADRLVAFWLDPDSRAASTWHEHRDINDVMLATAIAPRGYLELGN